MSNSETTKAGPASLKKIDLVDKPTGLMPTAIPSAGTVTPPQIATAYGIPASDGSGIKIGIISFGGGFLQSDINKSFADLRTAGLIDSAVVTPAIKQVLLDGNNGNFYSDLNSSAENTVDIFCVATMVPAADITIYIGSTWSTTLNRAITDGCHIITISWATLESTFLESILATAAANKIAVCVASGDWGSTFSGYSTLELCYPSSSPNVISIGGTHLYLNPDNTRSSETDDNRDPSFGSGWGGGGGVSAIFSRPSWQTGLYYTPITSGVTGNPTILSMRGVPDISAPMNAYSLYFNGSVAGYGGTSLSSPTVAGILARMQQLTGIQRSSAEYNAIFYASTGSFFDITVGTNNDQITSGYAGTSGWDAVTGLGPPIGASLLDSLTPPVSYPVEQTVLINSTNNLITTNITGVYESVSATSPSNGEISVSLGKHLYYTPDLNYSGFDSFNYSASSPAGNSSFSNILIRVVSPTPDIPITLTSEETVLSNSSNNVIQLRAINNPISFNIVSSPNYGVATILGQELLYTPQYGYYGSDYLQFTASNSFGTSNVSTILITVLPGIPTTSISSQTVAFNSINVPINLIVDGIYTNVGISIPPSHGIVSVNGTTVLYVPTAQYQGLDSFEYYVSNVSGYSNRSTIFLNVAVPVIEVSPNSGELTKGVVNTLYSPISLTASGGLAPYTTAVISGSLPPGITLNSNVIGGTPTRAGLYQFTIAITDNNSPNHFTVYSDYTLSIYTSAHTSKFQWFTNPGLLTTAISGAFTSTIVEASDINATYELLAGALPPGITLQSNGYISGTPTPVINLERHKFVIRASIPQTIIDSTFIIDVSPVSAPIWSYNTSPFELKTVDNNIFIDRNYVNIPLIATPPTISPTNYPITYKLSSNYNTLPRGLTISSNGILSGYLSTDTTPGIVDRFTFSVTASNSNQTSTQIFVMEVENVYSNLNQITIPSFVNPSFLGIFSDRENQYIPVTAYDPYPILGPIIYTTGTNTILPSGLNLDSNTGFLHGYVSTQTDYLVTYPVSIIATKKNSRTGVSTIAKNTFTLAIVHKDFDKINWVTPEDLGTIINGTPSTLKIESTQTSNIYPLQYGIDSGKLPVGLTLHPDGNIIGIPISSGVYTATIIASPAPYGFNSVKPNTTDFPFELNLRTFKLTVIDAATPYTNIYVKPLLSIEKRKEYRNFITNTDIFSPNLLYRANDPNFGVQTDLKMYLEYGIQKFMSAANYAPALEHNFYNRLFNYGNVKSLTTLDNTGKSVYDVVYVEIVDPLDDINSQIKTPDGILGTFYYPGSIQNMRTNLKSIAIVNPEVAPLFVKTANANGLGWLNIVVLCYALPEKGFRIVNKLKTFDFNQFEFYVDRITIESTLATNTIEPVYLIFPRKTI